MRIQPKSIQAEAIQWDAANPDTPYTFGCNTNRFAPHTKYTLVRDEFTPHQIQDLRVEHGDFIVKRPDSDDVEVYSPEEFHKRFNIVEPGAQESIPCLITE